jgi:hypothetical protein
MKSMSRRVKPGIAIFPDVERRPDLARKVAPALAFRARH